MFLFLFALHGVEAERLYVGVGKRGKSGRLPQQWDEAFRLSGEDRQYRAKLHPLFNHRGVGDDLLFRKNA
jgi:hypothetical protein